jgi:hypothetical protein
MKRFTIAKYYGDDLFSWAVFDRRTGQTVVTGCSRKEAQWHRDELEKMYSDKPTRKES